MIVVVFNKPDFEYDVHSLLKEFFPQEDVQMYYSCPPDEVEGKNLACTHHEMTDAGVKEFADASQVFKIDYVGEEIAVEWTVNKVSGNNSMTGDMQQADEGDTKTAGKSICTKIFVLMSMLSTGRWSTIPHITIDITTDIIISVNIRFLSSIVL